MTIHRIELSQDAVKGIITKEAEPIAAIQSGDSLVFRTLDAGWGTGDSYKDRTKPYARRNGIDTGHALIGPIFVHGAKPGMTLEIAFNELVPGKYGFTAAGQYPNWQNEKLKLTEYPEMTLEWELDGEKGTGSCCMNGKAFTVPLAPFMGLIGMPPEELGLHSTWPPRTCGGNIDCKELTAGSKLYLPIPVEGAYLYIGDGHARQGDGEVSCQAIECPMERVDMTITLMESRKLANPRANTPAGWITFGFHEDLNEATVQALDGMLDVIGELHGLSRVQAMAIGSSVIELRITQIVNGVKGVHALLPHDAFMP